MRYLIAALALLVPGAGAWAAPEAGLCGQAQQWLINAQLDVAVREYDDFEAFVDSKAQLDPLVVAQHFSHPLEDGTPRTVSCKMKTADILAATYDVETRESSCHDLQRRLLQGVQDELGSVAFTPVVDEEALTFMGPQWLADWPFEPAYLDTNGVLHLASRALYVPDSWWIPAPPAFKGVYYCHLASPAYLRALLSGVVQAPTAVSD